VDIQAHIYYQKRYIKAYAIVTRNGKRIHYSTPHIFFELFEGAVRTC